MIQDASRILVQGKAQYPECLNVPDRAGRIRTRSPATEAAYRRRYRWLRRRTTIHLERSVNILDVAGFVSRLAPTVRCSTYRQYRAAVLQRARDCVNRGAITLHMVVTVAGIMDVADPETGRLPCIRGNDGPVRCGHRRAKSLTIAHRESLFNAAWNRGSRIGRHLTMVIALGPNLGLRPHEWPTARVNGTILIVKCAKYSKDNGRAIGACRHLDIGFLGPKVLKNLAIVLGQMHDDLVATGGRVDIVVARLARELRRIRPAGSRVTLRTPRHQARATMVKAGLGRREIAAVMGHASADSQTAYGCRSRGWRIPATSLPSVAQALVVRVRPGASTASKIRNGKPLTRKDALEERAKWAQEAAECSAAVPFASRK